MNEYRFNKNGHKPEIKESSTCALSSSHKKSRLVPLAVVIAFIIAGGTVIFGAGYVVNNIVSADRTISYKDKVKTEDTGEAKRDFSVLVTSSGENMSIADIYDKVSPSVVRIVTKLTIPGIFGQQEGEGSGSGVIISDDGYIMTNNHVIEDAESIKVTLNNEKEYEAVLVGNDQLTDLAVIKISETGLPAAELGNSDNIRPGELAVAIGNPIGEELSGSLTVGVISGKSRKINVQGRSMKVIQTDAAINPGNSGGALVDSYGKVIGINTVKVSLTSVEGIGFAIPINEAIPIINSLVDNGKVVGRTYIGITGESTPYGVIVKTVSDDSPADKAGIKTDDLIVKVNGKTVKSVQEINEIKYELKVGDTITLTLYKDGGLVDTNVVLEEQYVNEKDEKSKKR